MTSLGTSEERRTACPLLCGGEGRRERMRLAATPAERAVRRRRQASALLCPCMALLACALFASSVCAEEQPAPQARNVKMDFRDAPMDTVLEQLSTMAGLVVVKDTAVEGRVTIISKQDMNVDEAISLLNTVLKEKGFVGIRTGRILKLVKLEEAKKRNIPVRSGSDPALIEANDEVITQVIPIKYIDAIQLKKDFAPLVPSYADLAANASSNTLILTDTSANIRRIAEIIRAMDTQSTVQAEVKVFQLKYANATSAARLINDIFKEEQQQQGNLPFFMRGAAAFMGGGGGGGARRRAGGGGGGGGGGPGGFGGGGGGPGPFGAVTGGGQADEQGQRIRRVTASSDERTNAVVVSAGADTMPIIAQVIKDLDANPAEEQAVFIYRCKNAQAVNLESVINTIFGATGGGLSRSATTQRTPGGQGTNVQRSASSSRMPGSSVTSRPAQQTFGGGGGGGFGGQGQFRGGGGGFGNQPAGAMTGDLTGQVYVVADIDSNSLIVLTASKNFERVKGVLTDLDRPVPQVLIKVLIAEVTHDKNDDLGVDVSVLAKGSLASVVQDLGVASATGGLIMKGVDADKDINVTLRALQTVGKLDILSRPYIMASDNQLSSITVGSEVPFVTSSRTTDTGQTINAIEYQDIGIILNVTAHINDEGLVIMDVAPEVSDLTGQTVPISTGVTAPVFAKRSAQSRVGVKDGHTVIIGGLMQDKKTENVTAVPGLSKIPYLGNLFRHKTVDKSKTELLIFLTPHVALDPAVLKRMADQEKAALKLTPNAVAPGAFQEHWEGMERGGEFVKPEEANPPRNLRAEPVPLKDPKP